MGFIVKIFPAFEYVKPVVGADDDIELTVQDWIDN